MLFGDGLEIVEIECLSIAAMLRDLYPVLAIPLFNAWIEGFALAEGGISFVGEILMAIWILMLESVWAAVLAGSRIKRNVVPLTVPGGSSKWLY